jgi:hypothetical protein
MQSSQFPHFYKAVKLELRTKNVNKIQAAGIKFHINVKGCTRLDKIKNSMFIHRPIYVCKELIFIQ